MFFFSIIFYFLCVFFLLAAAGRRGSWWSSSRGTVRVAVSLERLQTNIIRAALPPNRAPVGVPLGAGVGAGGVARAARQEAKGEEVLPPAELSCKVCRVLFVVLTTVVVAEQHLLFGCLHP